MEDKDMYEIIVGIISGLITTIIVSSFVLWKHKLNLRQKHSFISELLRDEKSVQIVLSSLQIENFKFSHETEEVVHNSPPNVLFMPYNEGYSVAELLHVIEKVCRNIEIKLVMPAQYDPGIPAIVIGGPSVNPLSKKLLKQNFPDFIIDYPDATKVQFRGTSFSTNRSVDDGFITHDYGFVFSSPSPKDKPSIVVCGILAFGTQLSTRHLINMDAKSSEGQLILNGKPVLTVIDGNVDNLEIRQGNFIGVYEG